MQKKIIGIGISILMILGVVMVSGCIGGSSSSGSKEIVVKELNIASLSSGGVFGSKQAIVDIPDNATKVRMVYSLKAKSSYGMGSNGNMGVNPDNIKESSGESPISYDNHYLEGGAGETISGEYTSTNHGAFYYEGSFASGKITIYATVPA